jgi:hypothetical protein
MQFVLEMGEKNEAMLSIDCILVVVFFGSHEFLGVGVGCPSWGTHMGGLFASYAAHSH